MLSIIPPTGELDCQLQSEIEREARRVGGNGVFGNSNWYGWFSIGWCMACILSVIELFMIVVKGNG